MTGFTHKVEERALFGNGRLLIASTTVKDIVAIEGSVLGGPNFLPHSLRVIPGLTADLLDTGTARQSKAKIREALTDRGATLIFSVSGDRTKFSGQCFPEDLPLLLATVSECFTGAIFPAEEVKSARQRALGALLEAKSDTRTQAEIAFWRELYDSSHPNYRLTLREREENLKQANRTELRNFKDGLGKGGLILAIVGDISAKDASRAAERFLEKLGKGTEHALDKKANKKPNGNQEIFTQIPDKASIDVFMGASLSLRKLDRLYLPMFVVGEMLGGGFIGHLMQTIREREGLTYGIFAGLTGFDEELDGAFRIWGTFAPNLYNRGIQVLRHEIKQFFKHGIVEETLAKKKEEIIGSYLVGLSTTRGLAQTLHRLAADGRPISYLNDFPSLINDISLLETKEASELVPQSKLSLSAAGSFPKK